MKEFGGSVIGSTSHPPSSWVELNRNKLKSPSSLSKNASYPLTATCALPKGTQEGDHGATSLVSGKEEREIYSTTASNRHSNDVLRDTTLEHNPRDSEMCDNLKAFPTDAVPVVPLTLASTDAAPLNQLASPRTFLPQEPRPVLAATGVHRSGDMSHSVQSKIKSDASSNFGNNTFAVHPSGESYTGGVMEATGSSSDNKRVVIRPSSNIEMTVPHHHYRHHYQQKPYAHQLHQYDEHYHHHLLHQHQHHHYRQHFQHQKISIQGPFPSTMAVDEFRNHPYPRQPQQLYAQQMLPQQHHYHHYRNYHYQPHQPQQPPPPPPPHEQSQQMNGMNSVYFPRPACADVFYTHMAPSDNTKPSSSANNYTDLTNAATPQAHHYPRYYNPMGDFRQEPISGISAVAPSFCECSSSAAGFINNNAVNASKSASAHHFSPLAPSAAFPRPNMHRAGSRTLHPYMYSMPSTLSPTKGAVQPYPRDNHKPPLFNATSQTSLYPYVQHHYAPMVNPVSVPSYKPFPDYPAVGQDAKNTAARTASGGGITMGINKEEGKTYYDITQRNESYANQQRNTDTDGANGDIIFKNRPNENAPSAFNSKVDESGSVTYSTSDTENRGSCQCSLSKERLHGCFSKQQAMQHCRFSKAMSAYPVEGPSFKETSALPQESTPRCGLARLNSCRSSGSTPTPALVSSSLQNYPCNEPLCQVSDLNNKHFLPRATTTLATMSTYSVQEVSSSTPTPITLSHADNAISSEGTPFTSQTQNPKVFISRGLDTAAEDAGPQDQPPQLVVDRLDIAASESASPPSATQEAEMGSKLTSANTTPITHPPCYMNTLNRYSHSFPRPHIATIDGGALPHPASTRSAPVPMNFESTMRGGPPSLHQMSLMQSIAGTRTFTANPTFPHHSMPHAHTEDTGIYNQMSGHPPPQNVCTVSMLASGGARSQPPPFGGIIGGEGGANVTGASSSPTKKDGCTSFNSPPDGRGDRDGLSSAAGYPMLITTFSTGNKRPHNSSTSQELQQCTQQYSYAQPQVTSFESPKNSVLGITPHVDPASVGHMYTNYRNLRPGAQHSMGSKGSEHFIYNSGTPSSPTTDTRGLLQTNPTNYNTPDANTTFNTRFHMPGRSYQRGRTHPTSHPPPPQQQQPHRGVRYNYPSGTAPLLYEYYVASTQETWMEEHEGDFFFDASLYGNIVCLVDSFSPQIPVAYELQFPFQSDTHSSLPQERSVSLNNSVASSSSPVHTEKCKIGSEALVSAGDGCGANQNTLVLSSSIEVTQCGSALNSPVISLLRKPVDSNVYYVSKLHSTPNVHGESISMSSCPIPTQSPLKRPNDSVSTGVVDGETAPAMWNYQDFEGGYFVEPIVSLSSVWQSFNCPFGCSVPLSQPVCLSHMRPPENEVVYTPLLSGFRIRFHDASPAYAKLMAIQSEQTNNKAYHKQGPNVSSSSPSVVISSSYPGLLTWSASERPDNRNGVVEQVEELARGDKAFRTLLTATTADIDHQSWMAIMWQPVFCGGHTAKQSCGTFLAFYMLRAPRHIFLPFANESVRASSGSSWDNPVFRIDHAMLLCDIWSFDRRYSVGRCVPPSPAVPPTKETTLSSAPQGALPFIKPTESETVDGTPCLSVPRDSSQSISSASGAARDPRHLRMTDATADFNQSTDFMDINSTKKHSSTSSTRQIRLPLVGLIFNRARSDVWLCPFMISSNEAMPGTGSHSSTCPKQVYRAPLFLVVSALQLMCWNAFEEDRRLTRLRLEKKRARNKDEVNKQNELHCDDVANTAYVDNDSHISKTSRQKANSTDGRRYLDLNIYAGSAIRSQVDMFPPNTRSPSCIPDPFQSELVYSDGEAVPSNTQSEYLSRKETNTHAISPIDDAVPSYYSKGIQLLVNAARHYRNLRETAMLDMNVEEATSYSLAFANAHTSASSHHAESNKEPRVNMDGKAPNHIDLPPRVVAGGTNIELCGELGSVIVGLLDFYQWAQYDSSITDFAERYSTDFAERESIYQGSRKALEEW